MNLSDYFVSKLRDIACTVDGDDNDTLRGAAFFLEAQNVSIDTVLDGLSPDGKED